MKKSREDNQVMTYQSVHVKGLRLGVFQAWLSYIQLLQALCPACSPLHLHSSVSAKACAVFCLLHSIDSSASSSGSAGLCPWFCPGIKGMHSMLSRLRHFSLPLQDFFSLLCYLWFLVSLHFLYGLLEFFSSSLFEIKTIFFLLWLSPD